MPPEYSRCSLNLSGDSMENPYAYLREVTAAEPGQKTGVYHDGKSLFMQKDAVLPHFCLWTNAPAVFRDEATYTWQPSFVYLFLVPFIVPYFLVSPFFSRQIKLQIPVGRAHYRRRMFWINFGFGLLATGAISITVGIVAELPLWNYFSEFRAVLILGGLLTALIGVMLSSSPLANISIRGIKNGYIQIANVHPDYLNRLP